MSNRGKEPIEYFECEYVNEDGVQCKNTTFIKEDVIKLAEYKNKDHYVEEIVDTRVRCLRCNHIQSLRTEDFNVGFSRIKLK